MVTLLQVCPDSWKWNSGSNLRDDVIFNSRSVWNCWDGSLDLLWWQCRDLWAFILIESLYFICSITNPSMIYMQPVRECTLQDMYSVILLLSVWLNVVFIVTFPFRWALDVAYPLCLECFSGHRLQDLESHNWIFVRQCICSFVHWISVLQWAGFCHGTEKSSFGILSYSRILYEGHVVGCLEFQSVNVCNFGHIYWQILPYSLAKLEVWLARLGNCGAIGHCKTLKLIIIITNNMKEIRNKNVSWCENRTDHTHDEHEWSVCEPAFGRFSSA